MEILNNNKEENKINVKKNFSSVEMRNNLKKTLLEKYGVENAYQSKELQDKRAESMKKMFEKKGVQMKRYNYEFLIDFCEKNKVTLMGDYLLEKLNGDYKIKSKCLNCDDDIWIQINIFFSKYINSNGNAEKLRHKLVKHKDKINLVVFEKASSLQKSIEMEYEWDYFFSEIIKQIESHTLDGVVKGFQNDFTTTNNLYKIISTAIIMNSFKEYFNYSRVICACGINNIYFAGTSRRLE